MGLAGGGRLRCKQRAGEGWTAAYWGNGEERTLNMERMVVTLEVSKLSVWLNAAATCRESKGRA